MVSVMTLSGYVVVGHGHSTGDTFWVISVHIVGMYGLVLVVGDLIDRVGRRPALVGGLAIMGISTIFMAWIESVGAMSLSLFGLGLGWSLSYVAATSELVDHAALAERGRLVGFSDLLSGFTGAALAILGGVAYDGIGVEAVAVGATLAVAAARAAHRARRPPAAARRGSRADQLRIRRPCHRASLCRPAVAEGRAAGLKGGGENSTIYLTI